MTWLQHTIHLPAQWHDYTRWLCASRAFTQRCATIIYQNTILVSSMPITFIQSRWDLGASPCSQSCVFVESRELRLLAGTVTSAAGSCWVEVQSRVAYSYLESRAELRLCTGSALSKVLAMKRNRSRLILFLLRDDCRFFPRGICCSAVVVGTRSARSLASGGMVGWCTKARRRDVAFPNDVQILTLSSSCCLAHFSAKIQEN